MTGGKPPETLDEDGDDGGDDEEDDTAEFVLPEDCGFMASYCMGTDQQMQVSHTAFA